MALAVKGMSNDRLMLQLVTLSSMGPPAIVAPFFPAPVKLYFLALIEFGLRVDAMVSRLMRIELLSEVI